MRLYLEPIDVDISARQLRRVHWRRQVFSVREVLERWISQTKWWSSEEKRLYFRLLTSDGILEIYRSGEQWVLSRIMD